MVPNFQLSSPKSQVSLNNNKKVLNSRKQSQEISQLLQSQIAEQQVLDSYCFHKNSSQKQVIKYGDNNFSKIYTNQTSQKLSQVPLLLQRRVKIITMNQIKKYQLNSVKNQLIFKQGVYSQDVYLKPQNKNKKLKKSLSTTKIPKSPTISNSQLSNSGHCQNNKISQNSNKISPPVLKNNQSKTSLQQILKQNKKIQVYSVPFCLSILDSLKQAKQNTSNYINSPIFYNKQPNLFKQINQSKYLIDVPLDFNSCAYELNIQLMLQQNRGVQLYLTQYNQSNQIKQIIYFKYQMIKLPFNLLRIRIYLLIQNQIDKKQEWKIWKEMQIPYFSDTMIQKKQQSHSLKNTQKSSKINSQNIYPEIIKISISTYCLSTVTIKINQSLQFKVKMDHPSTNFSYYCLEKDINGVQIIKVNLNGRQGNINLENINEGCQKQCQII